MDKPSKPRLILICGLPGAGKTTLSRRLADELPAIRLCEDEWMSELGFDLFDERARDRLERLLWRLAQSLLQLGQSVILESGFWTRLDRDEKRLTARALGAAVELRYLDVPFDELWRRIDQRNAHSSWTAAPITREHLESYVPLFQPPDSAELALFDAPSR